jgi:hypothetical protein
MWRIIEPRRVKKGVSLLAFLPYTRDSSGRQTVTSVATAATVSVRMSSVNVLIAGLQRLLMVLQSYSPEKALTRKNTPNTKPSTTVIVRLCFSIHPRKDTSMFEARCGTAA